MLACLMLLGTYYTLPIMLALCLMLLGTYYAQNYAGIIGRSLTDGIPVFKSSKFSVWPLYLVINELPLNKCLCSSNVILAGLWFGSHISPT